MSEKYNRISPHKRIFSVFETFVECIGGYGPLYVKDKFRKGPKKEAKPGVLTKDTIRWADCCHAYATMITGFEHPDAPGRRKVFWKCFDGTRDYKGKNKE